MAIIAGQVCQGGEDSLWTHPNYTNLTFLILLLFFLASVLMLQGHLVSWQHWETGHGCLGARCTGQRY